jgi:hypothetical protein
MHTHSVEDHGWFGYQIMQHLVSLSPYYNTVSTPAPRDILEPIIDYFADLYTGMGPYMSLKVCLTGIWTDIHEHVSSLVRSCMDSMSSITYTGDIP